MYNDTVMDHFHSPRNYGILPEGNASSKVTSSVTGDIVFLSLSIMEGCIRDIRGAVFGCAASIAAVSLLTTLVKGCSLDEADQITETQLIETMGGLPEAKLECTTLAIEALRQAMENYGAKND